MLLRLVRDERRFEWARTRLHRHGTLLITAGRYLPGVRAATMFSAGATRYPVRLFLVTDAIGAAVWSAYAAAVGYLGGAAFRDRPLYGLLLAFAIGLGVAVLIEVGRRMMGRRRVAVSGPAC